MMTQVSAQRLAPMDTVFLERVEKLGLAPTLVNILLDSRVRQGASPLFQHAAETTHHSQVKVNTEH